MSLSLRLTSLRSTRLIAAVLIGLCLGMPVHAATRHRSATKHRAPAKDKITLIWRGDVATATSVFDGLAKAWERTGHSKIELQPFNTVSGIEAVGSGLADLGGSARGNSGDAADKDLTFTPIAWDGLVIVTQKANPVSNLTLRQVHDIYFGKIHDWSEVGGSPAPIDVYAVASPTDGVEYSLRSLLFGRGTQPVAAPRLYVNTHMLEKGIELNANGFGVDTLADIKGQPGLKALSIDGVAPTLANIANGSYPLFTPLYVVTNPLSSKAAETQAFIDFATSPPGMEALRKASVLPYADGMALVALDKERRVRILAAIASAPASTSPTTDAASGNGTPSSVAAAKATATAAGDFYIVGRGDTLSTIAKKHAVQPQQLREWNHLKSDRVELGQSLRVSSN